MLFEICNYLNYFVQCANLFMFTFSSIWLWLYPNAPCQSRVFCLFDCLSICMSVCLPVCLSVCLFVCMLWFISFENDAVCCHRHRRLSKSTTWGVQLESDKRDANDAISLCASRILPPPPHPHTYTYVYNLALVEPVGRAVWVGLGRSLWLPAIFISFLSVAHYAALRRQMNPCTRL